MSRQVETDSKYCSFVLLNASEKRSRYRFRALASSARATRDRADNAKNIAKKTTHDRRIAFPLSINSTDCSGKPQRREASGDPPARSGGGGKFLRFEVDQVDRYDLVRLAAAAMDV